MRFSSAQVSLRIGKVRQGWFFVQACRFADHHKCRGRRCAQHSAVHGIPALRNGLLFGFHLCCPGLH